ncbi:hypothetical protein HK100_003555 [Physocladia obscura]|uniref:Uncharacterized protein n=1 Tax=Physocladia obscura TaxID=109957 RepID=A0AAD5TCE6_9FUNG|nr:hypothetical protein HK100_003555 [Physocladia obscura]
MMEEDRQDLAGPGNTLPTRAKIAIPHLLSPAQLLVDFVPSFCAAANISNPTTTTAITTLASVVSSIEMAPTAPTQATLAHSTLSIAARPSIELTPSACTRLNEAFLRLAALLAVPSIFAITQHSNLDSVLVSRFRIEAASLFSLLAILVDIVNQAHILHYLDNNTISLLLARCAAFLSDATTQEGLEKWSTSNSVAAASDLLNSLVATMYRSEQQYRQQSGTFPSTDHNRLILRHAKRILTNHIKPYFEQQHAAKKRADPAQRKVPGKQPKLPAAMRFMGHDEQPWKSESVECVAVFEWILMQIDNNDKTSHSNDNSVISNSGSISSNSGDMLLQGLVIPTVLVLMDDYDPKYKTLGIKLLRTRVLGGTDKTIDAADGGGLFLAQSIRQTGLEEVFFKTLRDCLTFHSQPLVLREAFLTIVHLVKTLHVQYSEDAFLKLAVIMEDGIVRGLKLSIGGKLDVIRSLVELTSEILELHTQDSKTQILACTALTAILRTCWPRASVYSGTVLKACATVWMNLDRDDVVEARDLRLKDLKESELRKNLRNSLQNVINVLWEICGDDLMPDVRMLVKLDPSFKKLTKPHR